MAEDQLENKVCVVVGASHAGVNFAFALRKEGWEGDIILFDRDPLLPYHRPPLSKTYLSSDDSLERHVLKAADSYQQQDIQLRLGVSVTDIDRVHYTLTLDDGSIQHYDQLVLATGASPLIPPIEGIRAARHCYPLRTAEDVAHIRSAVHEHQQPKVVIIGGGYIGLETAASLRQLGATVTVLEREERILARVTAPEMAQFFHNLHTRNGVNVLTDKAVISIKTDDGTNVITCADGSRFEADVIVLGCGIRVNVDLAERAGLEIENGIRVDPTARTSDQDIYAIGDCTFHYNPHYDRFIRLESVQNAVDQARVAAAAVAGKETVYDTIPWFWSDQYDIKLQIVGLSEGYDQALVRKEKSEGNKLSIWYFKEDTLLAVDAINNAKAYVIGTRFIKERQRIDKSRLVDPSVVLKPANLLLA